jgi:hypothetical protein
MEMLQELTIMFGRMHRGHCPFCGHEDPKSTLRDDSETMAEHREYLGGCQKCIDELVRREKVAIEVYALSRRGC